MGEWRWWWAGELLGRLWLGAAFNFSSTSNGERDKEEKDKEERDKEEKDKETSKEDKDKHVGRRRCKDKEERVDEGRDKYKSEGG